MPLQAFQLSKDKSVMESGWCSVLANQLQAEEAKAAGPDSSQSNLPGWEVEVAEFCAPGGLMCQGPDGAQAKRQKLVGLSQARPQLPHSASACCQPGPVWSTPPSAHTVFQESLP